MRGAALIVAAMAVGCAARPARIDTATPGDLAQPIAFALHVSADLDALTVAAHFPNGAPSGLAPVENTLEFVREFAVLGAHGWRAVDARDGRIDVAECAASACDVRYRFALSTAARVIDDLDVATRSRGLIESPPGAWLLLPTAAVPSTPIEVRVETAPGVLFATGLRRAATRERAFAAIAGDIAKAPFTVFGDGTLDALTIRGGLVEVARPRREGADEETISHRIERGWVERASTTVADYFGHFPGPNALVVVFPPATLTGRKRDEAFGWALGNGGGSVALEAPAGETEALAREDWVAVHELTHLAFPAMSPEHRWLREGLATYLGPLARVAAGTYTLDAFWDELLDTMPDGQPATETSVESNPWLHMYWRGARFCFLADLEIRRQTKGRSSLRDAMRAVLDAGGDVAVRWSPEHTLEVADRATDTTVLSTMYATWKDREVATDLDALWRQLGVRKVGARIEYDDSAPEAWLRKAIARRESP